MAFDFSAPGEHIIPNETTLRERTNILSEFVRLRAEGHALAVAETMEHAAVIGTIRITHYLTCSECARLLKEKQDGKMDSLPGKTPATGS